MSVILKKRYYPLIGVGKIFVLIFIFFNISILLGQQPQLQQVIPPLPTSLIFQKYGDYPVGHFTGVPDITVPLYEIKSKSLTHAMNLKYHASGFKPSEFNGTIAFGWLLNAGGRISRTIQGAPDDLIDFLPGFENKLTFSNVEDYTSLKLLETKVADSQYDIFSFDVGDQHNKFFLKNGANGKTAIASPYRPLKIEYFRSATEYSHPIEAFNVTDESGVLFRFGKSLTDGRRYTEQHFNQAGISSWLLTEIISADKRDTISFKYVAAPRYSKAMRNDMVMTKDFFNHLYLSNSPPEIMYWIRNTNVSIIDELNLKTITSKFNLISLEYDQQGRFVNKLLVYNKQSAQTIKSISFYRKNFDISSTDLNGYVKLDSIKTFDRNNDFNGEKYLFQYYKTENVNYNEIAKTDWWGYYNGMGSDTRDIIPYREILIDKYPGFYTEFLFSIGGQHSNLSANEIAMKNYMLKSITYPTAGKTEFDFEVNRYLDETLTDGGGLRIREIRNVTADKRVSFKNYRYGTAESGYGHASFPLDSYTKFRQYYVSIYNGPGDDKLWFNRETYYMPSIVPDFIGTMSSSVTYPEVTEYNGTFEDNSGKTTFKYVPYSNSILQYSPRYNLTDPYSSFPDLRPYYHLGNVYNWHSGQLLEKNEYKKIGPIYSKIRQLNNEYIDIQKEELKGLRLRRNIFTVNDNAGDDYINEQFSQHLPIYQFAYYSIPVGDRKISKSIDTYYTPQGVYTDTTRYYYDNLAYLEHTRIEKTDSKGGKLTSYLRRPIDKITIQNQVSLSSPTLVAIDTLIARNIISPILLTENYIGNTLKNRILINYRIQSTDKKIVLPSNIQVQHKSSPWTTEVAFNLYDDQGNLLEQQQLNGPKQSYVWSYGNRFPVAELKNMDRTTLVTRLGGDAAVRTFGNSINPDVNGFLASLRNITNNNFDINTYTFDTDEGIRSSMDSRGQKTSYEYDTSLRLKAIIDHSGNVIKGYQYHYAVPSQNSGIFYSDGVSQSFTKNNCSTGTGTSVIYRVSSGKYISTVSQEDADQKATEDLQTNGQTYANSNGRCLFSSIEKRGTFIKNDCSSGTGSSETYIVTAGKFTSFISQADADQKAQESVDVNGQVFANRVGDCGFSTVKLTNSSNSDGSMVYASLVKNGVVVANFNFPSGITNNVYNNVPTGIYNVEIICQDGISRRFSLDTTSPKTGTYIKFENIRLGGAGMTINIMREISSP